MEYLKLINGTKMRTVIRGSDGFGSQMLCMFLGYLNTVRDGQEFCYTPLQTILLANDVGPANNELALLNSIIKKIMNKLSVPCCSEVQSTPIEASNHEDVYPNVNKDTFLKKNLLPLHSAWPLESPYEEGTFNVVIHLRRGKDIVRGDVNRWTPSDYYNDLIPKLLTSYPKALIHTVSWECPELSDFNSSRVIHHTCSEGDEITEHYNMLVHADMLFLCSSTFSSSAALFNKNMVLLDSSLMKLTGCPTDERWANNFTEESTKWEKH